MSCSSLPLVIPPLCTHVVVVVIVIVVVVVVVVDVVVGVVIDHLIIIPMPSTH